MNKYVIHMVVRNIERVSRGTAETWLTTHVCQGQVAGEPLLFESEGEAHDYAIEKLLEANCLPIIGYDVRPFFSLSGGG